MLPEGERFQASLGGAPQDCPAWLLEALRGVGPQIVVVRDIDYAGARVQVYNSNGLRWARVLKSKSSSNIAGDIDMPNVDDIGLIVGTNGDEKAPVWLGGLNSIETDNTLEKDENFTSVAALRHRRYSKHETGSYTLLDKLGNFAARLFKRAAVETDPAKKNLDIRVNKDGTLSITHYKADGNAIATSLSLSADGSLSIENEGHQVALVATPGSEIFRYKHKKKNVTIQVTEDGETALADDSGNQVTMDPTDGSVSVVSGMGGSVVVQDTIEVVSPGGANIIVSDAEIQMALPGGTSIIAEESTNKVIVNAAQVLLNGGTVALSDALLQSPLVKSTLLAWLDTHVHTSAAPGNPTSPPVIPSTPLAPTLLTQQVTGG